VIQTWRALPEAYRAEWVQAAAAAQAVLKGLKEEAQDLLPLDGKKKSVRSDSAQQRANMPGGDTCTHPGPQWRVQQEPMQTGESNGDVHMRHRGRKAMDALENDLTKYQYAQGQEGSLGLARKAQIKPGLSSYAAGRIRSHVNQPGRKGLSANSDTIAAKIASNPRLLAYVPEGEQPQMTQDAAAGTTEPVEKKWAKSFEQQRKRAKKESPPQPAPGAIFLETFSRLACASEATLQQAVRDVEHLGDTSN